MVSALYFWLGTSPGLDLVTAGLGLEAKNYNLSLGLVDVGLTSALCFFYGLVNIPALHFFGSKSGIKSFW